MGYKENKATTVQLSNALEPIANSYNIDEMRTLVDENGTTIQVFVGSKNDIKKFSNKVVNAYNLKNEDYINVGQYKDTYTCYQESTFAFIIGASDKFKTANIKPALLEDDLSIAVLHAKSHLNNYYIDLGFDASNL